MSQDYQHDDGLVVRLVQPTLDLPSHAVLVRCDTCMALTLESDQLDHSERMHPDDPV